MKNLTVFQSTLPLQGETLTASPPAATILAFQSTLPLQGETVKETRRYPGMEHFNPLSLCRENMIIFRRRVGVRISIHSPSAGRD